MVRCRLGGRSGKKIGAHRIAYMLANPLEDISGKVIRHSCNNRWCVNVYHLSSGSVQDNVDDMVSCNRQARGAKNASSKLSNTIAQTIRAEYANRHVNPTSIRKLASKYGVTYNAIRLLINGKTWK